MKILVVGGAGYIGSHMTLMLRESGHEALVLDNLTCGSEQAVLGAPLIVGDSGDPMVLDRAFGTQRYDCVMHFASLIQVGESVQKPALYYRNNLCHTLELLDAMVRHDVRRFVFSSTAAIFGEPERVPIDEDCARRPINPYGRSKWMVEQMLRDYDRAYGLRSACLRYFNAAGADPEGRIGENHEPESHLIPLALRAAAGRGPLSIFGRDYDTPDGTCIRDYIHVVDLCAAHLLAVEALCSSDRSAAFNLGNGNGYSVQEVIDAVGKVTGRTVPIVEAPRRAGDPPRLVADPARALSVLGWQPRYPGIETMVRHAWAWERKARG
ncbi:MAG: UDP-glucose 4-epimerase GalE [Betaproteobacteria bacterium]